MFIPLFYSYRFRTSQGILDIVMNSQSVYSLWPCISDWGFADTPVFFIRDPTKFPHFIHVRQQN